MANEASDATNNSAADNPPKVIVEVRTRYLEAQSSPQQDQYVFSYTITIRNQRTDCIQLLTRAWRIHDADGKITEVSGDGVIGQQPFIPPGESFTYTSGTVLTTPLGSMQGHYGICDEQGDLHEVEVAPFRLAVPSILH